MRRTTAVMLLVLSIVAACGGQGASGAPASAQPRVSPAAGQATPVPAPSTATPAVANPGSRGTSIAHLEVGGGPQAGAYDGSAEKLDCNIGAGGSGATFFDLAATSGLAALTIISGEDGANPTKFYLQALFGAPSATQPFLEITTLDPSSARGQGKARLEDKGSTIKWTVDGTTADGVTIKATIECGPVDRR